MLDLTYVNKKKRRKRIRIIACLGAVGVIVLCIVALLAKQAGAFTVSLKRGTASLTLSTDSAFTTTKTYLTVGKVDAYKEYTYEQFGNNILSDPSDYVEGDPIKTLENKISRLDSDLYNTPDSEGAEGEDKYIPFFKYTFYVKNVGVKSADYDLSLNFANIGISKTNANGIETVLRVMFFENYEHDGLKTVRKPKEGSKLDEKGNPIEFEDVEEPYHFTLDDHDYGVFAMQNHKQLPYSNELISVSKFGTAQPFVSNNTVLQSKVAGLLPGKVVRYTFVFWIEGNDPDCEGEHPDNTLQLNATINAHETHETNDENQE